MLKCKLKSRLLMNTTRYEKIIVSGIKGYRKFESCFDELKELSMRWIN